MNHDDSVKRKIALLELAQTLGSVSQACRQTGFSRDSFYRLKRLYERGGEGALAGVSRRKPNLKNRLSRAIEARIIRHSLAHPTQGQAAVAAAMRKNRVSVSPAGVRTVWLRYDMQTLQHRLTALSAKVRQDGTSLSAEQREALLLAEPVPGPDAVVTECPGAVGVQLGQFMGKVPGIGSVYLNAFIDVYSQVAIASLCTTPTASSALDLLRRRVLPFFKGFGVLVQRVLIDRSVVNAARGAEAEIGAFLASRGIGHERLATPPIESERHPGRTFLAAVTGEFFSRQWQSNPPASLEELSVRLEDWLEHYNAERPCTRRYCYGKTPLATFIEAAPTA